MIRANKTISLLICGATLAGMAPIIPVNAEVKELEAKEGTIYDAKAFINGMYIYDGYKDENQESGTYFSTPKGDILIEDVSGTGDRYGMNYINFKDDDVLFNLATGQAEEDSEEDKLIDLESKFVRKVLNKADRYEEVNEGDFEIIGKIAEDNFSSVWYEGKAEDYVNDRDYTIYINENGEYIDSSETLNIVYYNDAGDKIKLDTYEDLVEYNEKINEELGEGNGLCIAMEKTLLLDNDSIYKAFVMVDRAKIPEDIGLKNKEKFEPADIMQLITGTKAVTVYTQKISMEKGNKKDGAYLPKKVESYEAKDLMPVLLQFMGGQVVHARISGKNIFVVEADYDNNKISMHKFKMSNVRETLDSGEKVSKKAIELDKDFDAVDDEDMKNFCIDTYGNLWILSKGRVKRIVNGELETVYKVDGTMDKLSVFDENSMIIWNSEEEIYSVVNNTPVSNEEDKDGSENEVNESEESKEEANNATEVQTGWIKNTDGSWSYKNLDGSNASGWIKDNDKWYYLNNDGIMATGWLRDGSDWYYLNASGDMKTGWHKDSNGSWYYLEQSGKMAYNTSVDGYKLDSNGVWVK